MLRLVGVCLVLGLASIAHAQAEPVEGEPVEEEPVEEEAAEAAETEELPALPPPVLEDPEPVAPAEPEPAPEEQQPQILMHIGSGDHPEWEDDGEQTELPRDVAFEVPGSDTGQGSNISGVPANGVDPEEPVPPFVVTVGAGYARLLGAVPIDLFRIEQRFEATVPDFETLRLGVSATQMIADNGQYIVGGGARIGMGVPFCEDGTALLCEGVVFVQPGFLTGLIGTRFDINASLSLRLILERVFQLAVDGGYSLEFDGNSSLFHVTGQAGFVF